MFEHQNLQKREETAVAPAESYNLPVVRPRMDVYENAEAFQLALEMPGADENEVSAVLEDGVLTVSGSTKAPSYGNAALRYSEYGACRYERRLALGDAIDVNGISAHLEAGVLRVTLPKRAEARPKRIAINVA